MSRYVPPSEIPYPGRGLLRKSSGFDLVSSVWLPDAASEQPVRMLAARNGRTAVCAQQRPAEPGATLLEVIPADALAAAVVGTLPAQPPSHPATGPR